MNSSGRVPVAPLFGRALFWRTSLHDQTPIVRAGYSAQVTTSSDVHERHGCEPDGSSRLRQFGTDQYPPRNGEWGRSFCTYVGSSSLDSDGVWLCGRCLRVA